MRVVENGIVRLGVPVPLRSFSEVVEHSHGGRIVVGRGLGENASGHTAPFVHDLQNVGRRGPLAIFPEPGRVLAVMVALDDVEWTVLLKPQQQIPARRHRTREAGSGVGAGAPLDIVEVPGIDDCVDVRVRDGGDALWEMNHYVRRSRLH